MSDLKRKFKTPSGQVLEVRLGDLTRESTAAIVNAANNSLVHGGGVALAIVERGGEQIQAESDLYVAEHGPVPTGQVATMSAGRLPCRWIIHAVGPVWQGGTSHEDELLHDAVWNSLVAAHALGLESIALPAISSGIFGFPKLRCAQIMLETALEFCRLFSTSPLRRICFTNIDQLTVGIFENELTVHNNNLG